MDTGVCPSKFQRPPEASVPDVTISKPKESLKRPADANDTSSDCQWTDVNKNTPCAFADLHKQSETESLDLLSVFPQNFLGPVFGILGDPRIYRKPRRQLRRNR